MLVPIIKLKTNWRPLAKTQMRIDTPPDAVYAKPLVSSETTFNNRENGLKFKVPAESVELETWTRAFRPAFVVLVISVYQTRQSNLAYLGQKLIVLTIIESSDSYIRAIDSNSSTIWTDSLSGRSNWLTDVSFAIRVLDGIYLKWVAISQWVRVPIKFLWTCLPSIEIDCANNWSSCLICQRTVLWSCKVGQEFLVIALTQSTSSDR